MSGYYKYAAVFKSTILNNLREKIIMDPVRIEIFEGERTYKIPYQQSRILLQGEEGNISRDISITLTKDHYIEFIARTKEETPNIAQEFCEQQINKAVTILSCMYSPDIFDKVVYRGWLLEHTGIMSAWIKSVNKLSLDSDEINKQLEIINNLHTNNNEIAERFLLMSKFYAKSLLYDPGEEKFLFLWTILEIFPMKNTSEIKPISTYLSKITGQKEEVIKEKLHIGRMYGIRCGLVHDGQFKVDLKNEGEFFSKIETIVESILRNMIKLPYNKRLDKYLI
jgi:hypothetical protein